MTIDTQQLRELAQKATPGPWTYFPYPKYKEHHVSLPIDGSGMTMPLFPDGCQTSRQREDAEFIAAANPATVLALLDEIDRLRTIESAARNLAKVKGRHYSELAMN